MDLIPLEKFAKQDLLKLGKCLKVLSKSESQNTIIQISNGGENPCVRRTGYLIVSKAMLTELSTRLLSGEFNSEGARILLHVLHAIEQNEEFFLNLDEFDEKHGHCLPSIFKIHQHYCLFKALPLLKLPRMIELAHPLNWASGMCVLSFVRERVHKFNITMSEKILNSSSLYIDADAEGFKKIEAELSMISASEDNDWIKSLTSEQEKCLEKLAKLIGFNRVENLSLILDKQWEYYSTETNAIIEIQEAAFVNGEGNPNIGNIPRAARLLKQKYPMITGELPDDPKKYNAATKRITTAVNPDREVSLPIPQKKIIV